jgi:hypothetical protein
MLYSLKSIRSERNEVVQYPNRKCGQMTTPIRQNVQFASTFLGSFGTIAIRRCGINSCWMSGTRFYIGIFA